MQIGPKIRIGIEILFPEIGDRRDVEIEDIDEQPARRTVGAELPGLIGEQGVQGIDADDAGACLGGEIEQRLEVSEVADAPVALRAQAVELHRRTPDPSALAQCRRLVALVRRDDQLHPRRLRPFGFAQLEAVVAGGNGLRQRQESALVPGAGHAALGHRFEIGGEKVAAPAFAVLQRQ